MELQGDTIIYIIPSKCLGFYSRFLPRTLLRVVTMGVFLVGGFVNTC